MEIVGVCEIACMWQQNGLLAIKSEVPMEQTAYSFIFLQAFFYLKEPEHRMFSLSNSALFFATLCKGTHLRTVCVSGV